MHCLPTLTMKRISNTLTTATLQMAMGLLISTCTLRASAIPELENCTRNPGFEQLNATGQPLDWSWYNNMGQRPTALTHFSIDTNTFNVLPFCSNGNTARVVNGTRPDGTKDGNGGFIQSRIPVLGGAVYLLSMKHIEDATFDANLYICITQYDADGKSITGDTYYFATNIQPSHDWRAWSRLFTPKPNTVSIDLVIVPNGRGTVWFDDITLVRQPAPAQP